MGEQDIPADVWYPCVCDRPNCTLKVRFRRCEAGHLSEWSEEVFGEVKKCMVPDCLARYIPGFVKP